MTDAPLPFNVWCLKTDDGRRVLFQAYARRSDAEAVVAALQRVGCRSILTGPGIDDEDHGAPRPREIAPSLEARLPR